MTSLSLSLSVFLSLADDLQLIETDYVQQCQPARTTVKQTRRHAVCTIRLSNVRASSFSPFNARTREIKCKIKKKTPRETQNTAPGCSKAKPKVFDPLQTPFQGGGGTANI